MIFLTLCLYQLRVQGRILKVPNAFSKSTHCPISTFSNKIWKTSALCINKAHICTHEHTRTHNSATPGTQDITDPVYFVKVLACRVNLSYSALLIFPGK